MMRKDCLLVLPGLICFFASGCFCYGPNGHPGAYVPPSTAMIPQSYGAIQSPPATTWIPASPTSSSALSAPEPGRKGAPTSFGEDEEFESGKSVPTPSDLKKNRLPEVESSGFDEDASLERRGVRTSQRSRPSTPADDDLSGELEPPEAQMPLAADEAELPRLGARSANFNTQVRAGSVVPASAVADKYGYDAESYKWLKGVIEFNPKLQIWHLTYSQNPDDNDQFGGEVTLKNTAHFKYLRNGEAVRVEGQFDSQQVDRLGKPVYEVARIIRDVKR